MVNQKSGRAFQQRGPAFGAIGQVGKEDAEKDNDQGQNEAARDGIVPAVHGVLNGVADQEDRDEFAGPHLADLPFPAEPQQEQNRYINDRSPGDEHPPGERCQPKRHGRNLFFLSSGIHTEHSVNETEAEPGARKQQRRYR